MELKSEASSNGTHTMNLASPTVTIAMEEPMKRKRGRPRKYPVGGPPLAVSPLNTSSAAAVPAAVPAPVAVVVPESISDAGGSVTPVAPTSGETVKKKARGRPPGSLNKKKHLPVADSGSTGVGFTPHIITVKAGEDIYSKIMSFSQQCSSAVCILSANGAISNVTLHQAATSGGTVTYEGRYEILSLSGSFLMTNSGGQRSRTGGLSVSLAGPDGRVLGGGVEGLLTAAAPVQVIVGSFIADENREKQISHAAPTSAPPKLAPVRMAGINSPSSQGIFISGASASPHNQSTVTYNSQHQQTLPNMPWKQG